MKITKKIKEDKSIADYKVNYAKLSIEEKLDILLSEILYDLEDGDDDSLIRRFFNDIHTIAVGAYGLYNHTAPDTGLFSELCGSQIILKECLESLACDLGNINNTLQDIDCDIADLSAKVEENTQQ